MNDDLLGYPARRLASHFNKSGCERDERSTVLDGIYRFLQMIGVFDFTSFGG